MSYNEQDRHVGDVFQINDKYDQLGWVGAFIMATEIKSWGIQGFAHHIETHEYSSRHHVRIKWEYLEYIGRASMIPSE